MTSIRSAGILDSKTQQPPTSTQGGDTRSNGYVDGHSKCVESILNISQCIQTNAAVWDVFDSTSPSETVADFQCSLDLSELDRSLRSLEKSLDELNALRVQMKIRILGLQKYCRPLLLEKAIKQMQNDLPKVPDDILAGIFQAGHDMDRCEHSKFVVSVSHVSRRFRDVALSTPRLWTRFQFRDHPFQISEFIARSRNVCGLEIDATARTISPSNDAILSEFLDLLLPHSSRWSRLAFEDNAQARLSFHYHTNIRLPELRHLETFHGYDFKEVYPIWTNWEMRLLNRYSSMTLGKTYFCPQLEVTQCNLKLSRKSLDVARLVGLLTGMTRLQNLTLDCSLDYMDISTVLQIPADTVAVLSIHSLELRLRCYEYNDGAQFKYLESIYTHMQFEELSRLKIILDPLSRGTDLGDLATAGLSPYPSKIENVALEIDREPSRGAELLSNISLLIPGCLDIGELLIDTLQSSPFAVMNSVPLPKV